MSGPRRLDPPLDELQRLGNPLDLRDIQQDDFDYVTKLDLVAEHVPTLVEVAQEWADETNKPEGDALWAPIHAWLALAQLKAREAVEPLLGILNRLDEIGDDWYLEEYPDIFAQIGPAAIPAVASFLFDRANRLYPRNTAAHSLYKIGQRYTETREQVVGHLSEQLKQFENEKPHFNGFVIGYLMDLKARKSAELIEHVYAARCVDESIVGHWGIVRKELGVAGLGLAPDEPQSAFLFNPFSFVESIRQSGKQQQRQKMKKTKSKRKQEKRSRKRKRKRM